MSLQELKECVLALPERDRHDFLAWANRIEVDYGDVDPEAVAQLVVEVWEGEAEHGRPHDPAR